MVLPALASQALIAWRLMELVLASAFSAAAVCHDGKVAVAGAVISWP